MPESLDTLIAHLDDLLRDLEDAVDARRPEIDGVAPGHRRGARNLVRYTALRQHDVRALQNDLMDVGATSLATAEANVPAKVQAARNVLAALRGDPGPWDLRTIDDDLDAGDDILDGHADALFGPGRQDRRTRIMVTLPAEAADDPALVAGLVEAGMDVARINCAHDGPDAWARMIEHVHAASAVAGRRVPISMDLAGPKLRTGPIADGPAVGRARVARDAGGHLRAPVTLWLVAAGRPGPPAAPEVPGGRPALTVSVDARWWDGLRVGEAVSLRDNRGRRRVFTVTEVTADGVVAQGRRSAYVADGTVLECAGRAARAGAPADPRAVRGRTSARGLGHAGAGNPGQDRAALPGRDHRRRNRPARRLRDAEQGPVHP